MRCGLMLEIGRRETPSVICVSSLRFFCVETVSSLQGPALLVLAALCKICAGAPTRVHSTPGANHSQVQSNIIDLLLYNLNCQVRSISFSTQEILWLIILLLQITSETENVIRACVTGLAEITGVLAWFDTRHVADFFNCPPS